MGKVMFGAGCGQVRCLDLAMERARCLLGSLAEMLMSESDA